MSTKSTFGSRLKNLRDEKGISQVELAAVMGVTRGSVSYYEKGERTADIEALSAASRYFGVPSDWLLGITNTRAPENVSIGERTGLSDEVISHLGWLQKQEFKTAWTADTINALFTQNNFDGDDPSALDKISAYLFSWMIPDRVECSAGDDSYFLIHGADFEAMLLSEISRRLRDLRRELLAVRGEPEYTNSSEGGINFASQE